MRDFISARLESGAHSVQDTAASLGVSERTLRRRLEDAGFSYRSLLDQVRRERAVTLIEDKRLRITEIAQRVGFSDPSAFAATFKRWTGRAPRSARRSET